MQNVRVNRRGLRWVEKRKEKEGKVRWVGFLVSRPQQCTRWALGGGDSSGRVEARVVEVTTVSVPLSAEQLLLLASSLTVTSFFDPGTSSDAFRGGGGGEIVS